MNHLIREILGPFASAIVGAIIGVVLAIFLFDIHDKQFINGFALVGAILGVMPDLLRILNGFARAARVLQSTLSKRIEPSENSFEAANFAKAQLDLIAAKQEEQRKILEVEHEARRPICTHCGKKTEPVYRHRNIDGGPDRRYHENPLLCNKCFRPYTGVRPWKLPNTEPKS